MQDTRDSSPNDGADERASNGKTCDSPVHVAQNAGDLRVEISPARNSIRVPEPQYAPWSPTLQNLLDRPPSVLPQRLLMGGVIFCTLFGLWAWFGRVEEIGHASGMLVPEGETYKVHPVEQGKVSNILVEEGDEIRVGQVIARLETELAEQEVDRLQQKLADYQFELLQKRSLLERLHSEARLKKEVAAAETTVKNIALEEARKKKETLQRLLAQLRLEREAQQQQLERLKPLLAVSRQRLTQIEEEIVAHKARIERLGPLSAEGVVSQEYVFNAEQSLRQARHQFTNSTLQEVASTQGRLFQVELALRDLESRIVQNEGELAAVSSNIEALAAEAQQKLTQEESTKLEFQQRIQQLEVEITRLGARIAESRVLLASARTRFEWSFLRAQVDGTISSLNLENEGEVVRVGQTIAEIAPKDSPLVLSASLPSKEAGFVKTGMEVNVKLDAYPYQDYGVIAGEIISISPDAVRDEQLGTVYTIEVALSRDYVVEDGQKVMFQAGQTAVADIVVRRRRLAAYILDPIQKLKEDGVNL